MDIKDFPTEIKNVRTKILKLDSKLEDAKNELNMLDLNIELVIKTEGLKNDQERKTRRLELKLINDTYKKAESSLKKLERQKEGLEIDLEFLINEFTVAKLMVRDSIVKSEIISKGGI